MLALRALLSVRFILAASWRFTSTDARIITGRIFLVTAVPFNVTALTTHSIVIPFRTIIVIQTITGGPTFTNTHQTRFINIFTLSIT
jgi:hypothetical protein